MSKLALIVIFAVVVVCVTANRPRPVCHAKNGEALMGPGYVCEMICAASKLHKPVEKCMKMSRPRCLCCRKSGYCRSAKSGKCRKMSRRA